MTESLPLDGDSLTLAHFLAVARGGCTVSLTPEARQVVSASRRVVERAVAAHRTVYGVTTGFGSLSDRVIPIDQARRLQVSLIRSHASGTGPSLPPDVVRGLVLLRLNSLARGYSGVRPELLDLMVEVLNRRLVPHIPEQGSVGASGDLAPLAHLGTALLGEGEFLAPDGTRRPAMAVLSEAGLRPIEFHEKEGVALVNGTSLMTSYLALAVADARDLLAAAEVAAALSFDSLRGNPIALDDRLGELRHLPEQREEARVLRTLLKGSQLAALDAEHPGQDPYTLRCLPQVLAAVRLSLDFAEKILTTELNAVSDNPVVFEGDEFVNGGNFHGQSLALGLDTLALGVQYIAGFSERRIARLVHPALNRGLPPFLAPEAGVSSGFMIPQEPDAGPPGERREPADLGGPGGLRQHGALGRRETPPGAGECPEDRRHRMDRRRAGARTAPPFARGRRKRGRTPHRPGVGGAVVLGPVAGDRDRPRGRPSGRWVDCASGPHPIYHIKETT
ncbi:MAG: aromatic amino acid ammonia-lyase, partial [Thermoplasmata archaeon]|nr:aromatic amino acid ammonia-lyase [Thermoplasmata archaeon]